jgi:peptidoglycan-associated lipoprotein
MQPGKRRRIAVIAVYAAVGASLLGCPPKKKRVAVEAGPPAEMIEASAESVLSLGPEWSTHAALEPVHFETNRSDLGAAGREVLKRNAVVLRKVFDRAPAAEVRVEGHCDERSTLEYNLALGQRRADAVRSYYAALGLPKKSLSAVSYGEERPVCNESAEPCWRRNRRGDTALRLASGPLRINLEPDPSLRP